VKGPQARKEKGNHLIWCCFHKSGPSHQFHHIFESTCYWQCVRGEKWSSLAKLLHFLKIKLFIVQAAICPPWKGFRGWQRHSESRRQSKISFSLLLHLTKGKFIHSFTHSFSIYQTPLCTTHMNKVRWLSCGGISSASWLISNPLVFIHALDRWRCGISIPQLNLCVNRAPKELWGVRHVSSFNTFGWSQWKIDKADTSNSHPT
jgi:hypothetical protein